MPHLNENKQPVHMRYQLFLQYGWFLQNLGKDIIRTNMHTTVWKTSVSWTDTETLLGLHKTKLPEILNSITQRKLLSISNTISNIIVPTSLDIISDDLRSFTNCGRKPKGQFYIPTYVALMIFFFILDNNFVVKNIPLPSSKLVV